MYVNKGLQDKFSKFILRGYIEVYINVLMLMLALQGYTCE